jgi:AcrR family transcriptional regulator
MEIAVLRRYSLEMPRINAESIDQHKLLTRAAILSAAKELIGETRTADVPLGELTAAAGIGRTTFYEYFDDRDDVIAALVEDELPSVISGLIDSLGDDGTVGRLGRLIEATVEFVVDNEVLGLILHTEAPRLGRDAQERIRAAHSGLSGEMAALYLDGVQQGDFVSMDPRLAGRLIQDAIMSAAKTVILAPDPEAMVGPISTDVRRFLLAGLGASSES